MSFEVKPAHLICERFGVDHLEAISAYARNVVHTRLTAGGVMTLIFTPTDKTDAQGVPIWRLASDPLR